MALTGAGPGTSAYCPGSEDHSPEPKDRMTGSARTRTLARLTAAGVVVAGLCAPTPHAAPGRLKITEGGTPDQVAARPPTASPSATTPLSTTPCCSAPQGKVPTPQRPQGHLYNEHDAGDDLVPNLRGTLGPSPYGSTDAHVAGNKVDPSIDCEVGIDSSSRAGHVGPEPVWSNVGVLGPIRGVRPRRECRRRLEPAGALTSSGLCRG